MTMRALSVLGFSCLVGCSPQQPALHPEVMAGTGRATGKVLVLSAQCGSVEQRCPDSYSDAVDEIVRSGLEFNGYPLLDPATLQDTTRSRYEVHEQTDSDNVSKSQQSHDTLGLRTGGDKSETHIWRVTEKKTVILDGPTFDDLSIEARDSVIARSGAGSIITTRIIVGANVGVWSPDQTVEVQVKLGTGRDNTMVWASRCTSNSNEFSTVSAALESATRCAMMGAVGK